MGHRAVDSPGALHDVERAGAREFVVTEVEHSGLTKAEAEARLSDLYLIEEGVCIRGGHDWQRPLWSICLQCLTVTCLRCGRWRRV